MKLLEQKWQCEECDEIYVVPPRDDRSRVPVEGGASICIDFTFHANPWYTLCPKCVARLEKTWPKLVAIFRKYAKENPVR